MTRKRISLVVLVLVAAAAGLGAFWPFPSRPAGLRLPGTVQSHEVRLGPRVGGRVAAVRVAEGDRVVGGQELVRLELPELEARRDQERAKLALARAELRKARNGPLPLELREAGEAWKAAEARWRRLCAGPRPEEVSRAEQEKEAADAELSGARDHYKRVVASGRAATRADLEAATSRRDRAAALAAAAKASLRLLHAGSRAEEREEARAERDRLRAKLDLLRAGTRKEDVARAEAEAERAANALREVEAQLREASVRAPGPGRVEVVSVRAGDLAPANGPLVRLLPDGEVWVRAFVPETELARVRVGQPVEVTIDSHTGRPFPGTVYHVAGEGEFTPRNVQTVDERRHQVFAIKVRVKAPAGVLKPGMAAEVFLPVNGGE